MDLGLFRRTRVGMCLWAFVLPVSTLVLHYGTDLYYQYVSRKLDQRSAVMQLLPEASRRLDEVRTTLAKTGARARSEATATAELNSLLSHVAEETNFTILSLKVRPAEDKPKKGLGMLEIQVEGNGLIQDFMKFVYEAQRSEALLMIKSMKVLLVRKGDAQEYRSTLTMNYYILSG